jgi:HAD superfamily hydrolase (TIGR01509 family)
MISKIKKRYKAIIFDLDGTLINSLPYHILAFEDLFLEHGIRIDEDEMKKLVGFSTSNILQIMKKKYKFKEKIQDLREERRYHYFKFLGRKNIVFPGLQKNLEFLRLSHKLAIATGSSRVTFEHSTDRDFRGLFDAVITINDVKLGKPHPYQLLAVAKTIRVKAKECLVVGDSIQDGIAAKKAGMDFIGVLTGYTSERELKKEGAIRVLKSARDLNRILG